MPYKDPERKKEWERLHRPERLARRRELRRTEATQPATRRDHDRAQRSGVPDSLGRRESRGTLEYRISELGRSRLRWLRSPRS